MAALGPREAALELVRGIAEVVAAEADGIDDDFTHGALVFLLVDILDAVDKLKGRA